MTYGFSIQSEKRLVDRLQIIILSDDAYEEVPDEVFPAQANCNDAVEEAEQISKERNKIIESNKSAIHGFHITYPPYRNMDTLPDVWDASSPSADCRTRWHTAAWRQRIKKPLREDPEDKVRDNNCDNEHDFNETTQIEDMID